MAKEIPKISDAEWEIMKIIWKKSPLTSSEIIKELKPISKWKPKTIHTLISRLVEKKALRAEKGISPFYLYYPLVNQEECRKIETKSFLKKVYGGSFSLLVANFTKEQKLTPQEIEELKRILEERQDDRR
jgi:BlaI family penicillinase repressor